MISFSVASKGLSGQLPGNSDIWESFSEVESLDFSGNSLTVRALHWPAGLCCFQLVMQACGQARQSCQQLKCRFAACHS